MNFLENLSEYKDFDDENIETKVKEQKSWHKLKHKLISDVYKSFEMKRKRSNAFLKKI